MARNIKKEVQNQKEVSYTNKDFKQTINLLHKKTLGPLNWIEYRELKNGANAFKEIHDGTCVAPKIILIP